MMDKLLEALTRQALPELLNYTQVMMALLDGHGQILSCNPAMERKLTGNSKKHRVQDMMNAASQVNFAEMLLAPRGMKGSLQLLPASEKFEFDCFVQPVGDGQYLFLAEPSFFARDAAIAHLLDTLKATRHTLEIKQIELESVIIQADEVSHTDSLTFLSNRKRIIADLQREVAACDRYRKPLTIFLTDLDHFKLVNDTYGHAAGDQVLRALSGRMQSGIREIDKLGRYGGEEFLFLLPATTIKASLKMADRLLELVRSLPITFEDSKTIHTSISIGIAQYRIGKEAWDELLKRADKALYLSKNNGRDQWTIANDNDKGNISSRSTPAQKAAHKESE